MLLDLKEGCAPEDLTTVVQQLHTLSQIDGVLDLSVSERYDTGDGRARRSYDFLLSMEFADRSALEAYGEDEQHLAVRAEILPYPAGPPQVIDALEGK